LSIFTLLTLLFNPILYLGSDLVTLSGRLTDIKQVAAYVPITGESFIAQDVVEKREQRLKIGAIIGVLNNGLASLSAGMNRKRFEPEVPAVFISAKLDDKPIQGWVGFGKLNEGDDVNIIATKNETHYEVYAITRSADKTISILPSCEAGHKALLRLLIRHYFQTFLPICATFFFFVILVFIRQDFKIVLIMTLAMTLIAIPCLLGIMWGYYKDYRKGVCRLAENIFNQLNWADPERIDLYAENRKIIRQKTRDNQYPQWTEDERGIRPAPYRKESANKGFFYYK